MGPRIREDKGGGVHEQLSVGGVGKMGPRLREDDGGREEDYSFDSF